jgi:hypothetical protein
MRSPDCAECRRLRKDYAALIAAAVRANEILQLAVFRFGEDHSNIKKYKDLREDTLIDLADLRHTIEKHDTTHG